MWLLCASHCSASGESQHPAHPQWKRWRSRDEEQSTSWYTADDKRLRDFFFFCVHDRDAWSLNGGQKGQRRAGAHIAVHFCRSTTEHPAARFQRPPQPLPHHLPASLWQRQQLSDISFHYGSTPCLHHGWTLDEARSTVNCQAELIRTQGRGWEWLRNWNELEWKKRLGEWDTPNPRLIEPIWRVFFL